MASVSRLKIGEPFINPSFFPLACEKYITFQPHAKFDSRQYDFWNEVLFILKPYLEKENISIIQLGGKDDVKPEGVDIDLCGKTSYRQSFGVMSKALLHLGVDSLCVHAASALNIKIVALYSNMYFSQSGPIWSDPDDIILLQAPLLNGRRPSYSQQDNPKIINLIQPETIAKSVLSLLNIPNVINRTSLYFGPLYAKKYLESVPDCIVAPSFSEKSTLNIRFDYVADSETTRAFLYNQIQVRKSAITTDKLLDEKALSQLRQNIIQVIIKVKDEMQIPVVRQIEKLGIPYVLVSSLGKEELTNLKISYINYPPIQNETVVQKSTLPMDKISRETQFKTSKLLLSQNKVYLSKAHWISQISSSENAATAIGDFIDNDIFWDEAEFYYLFN